MSIGDVHSQERGSGARFNTGKVPLELVPLSALEDCARVFGYGREKYAAWNWAKGMDWSIPYACLLRHMAAWFNGEDNDPESGLPHLGHAMCNLVMLSTFAKTYPEGDDRPAGWLSRPSPQGTVVCCAKEPALDRFLASGAVQEGATGLQASILAARDGYTADGGGIIPHGVAEAAMRAGMHIDPERDDDEGAPVDPYAGATCNIGGRCDD